MSTSDNLILLGGAALIGYFLLSDSNKPTKVLPITGKTVRIVDETEFSYEFADLEQLGQRFILVLDQMNTTMESCKDTLDYVRKNKSLFTVDANISSWDDFTLNYPKRASDLNQIDTMLTDTELRMNQNETELRNLLDIAEQKLEYGEISIEGNEREIVEYIQEGHQRLRTELQPLHEELKNAREELQNFYDKMQSIEVHTNKQKLRGLLSQEEKDNEEARQELAKSERLYDSLASWEGSPFTQKTVTQNFEMATNMMKVLKKGLPPTFGRQPGQIRAKTIDMQSTSSVPFMHLTPGGEEPVRRKVNFTSAESIKHIGIESEYADEGQNNIDEFDLELTERQSPEELQAYLNNQGIKHIKTPEIYREPLIQSAKNFENELRKIDGRVDDWLRKQYIQQFNELMTDWTIFIVSTQKYKGSRETIYQYRHQVDRIMAKVKTLYKNKLQRSIETDNELRTLDEEPATHVVNLNSQFNAVRQDARPNKPSYSNIRELTSLDSPREIDRLMSDIDPSKNEL